MRRSRASGRLPRAAVALALAMAARGAHAGPGDDARRRDEARSFVAAYAGAVAEGAESLRGTGTWPSQGYEGLRMETRISDLRPDRVAYDVVATVLDEPTCQGALQGGLDGAATVHIGRLILLPSEVREFVEPGVGRTMARKVRPADYLCHERSWPVELRFSHDALVHFDDPSALDLSGLKPGSSP